MLAGITRTCPRESLADQATTRAGQHTPRPPERRRALQERGEHRRTRLWLLSCMCVIESDTGGGGGLQFRHTSKHEVWEQGQQSAEME